LFKVLILKEGREGDEGGAGRFPYYEIMLIIE